MLVQIVKQPTEARIDGLELKHYIVGEVYDIEPLVAEYLVVNGFAIVEVRHGQRSARKRPNDRRQSG